MNTQFKKGVLELCVLSLLVTGDKYGYELAEKISSEIEISEGTLYLLLRRLRNEGYFEVYLQESSAGPARKYYKLTEKGRETQQALMDEWLDFTKKVGKLTGGNKEYDET